MYHVCLFLKSCDTCTQDNYLDVNSDNRRWVHPTNQSCDTICIDVRFTTSYNQFYKIYTIVYGHFLL